MSTMQIRNVPDEVSRELKVRAAASGRSLSEYLLVELTRIAQRPTLEQALANVRGSTPRDLTPAVDVLADERGDRP